MVYQNVLGIQGFGLEGYPTHSLANTGCKHFSAFDGPMNWGTAELSDTDWFLNCPSYIALKLPTIVVPA
eukprot:SAG31_NODE_873_length_11325_cov_34.061197_11_plen_69_part_00